MAFCNKCGASVDAGVRFCNKCGAPILASTLPPASAAPTGPVAPAPSAAPAAPAQGGGALKVILIVVGVIVLLGILGSATVGFFVWRVAKSSRVRQDGDRVRVETPIGTVETNNPEEAARNLGVEIYPGARIQKDGTSTATFGGIHTASAAFESDDSLEKVCAFYKAKFPNAMATTSDEHHCTVVSSDKKNMITISIETDGDKTKVQIANVTGKPDSAKPSSD